MAWTVVLILLLQLSRSQTSYPPPNDYSYTANVLLNQTRTGMKNETFRVNLSFSLKYQGSIYNELWFNTDGVVSFGQPYYRPYNNQEDSPTLPTPPLNYIKIASNFLLGSSLLIRSTSTNVTIDYQACEQATNQNLVHWILTYYSNDQNGEMLDIDILQNNLLYGSGIMIAQNKQLLIETKAVQLIRYKQVMLWSTGAILGIALGGMALIAILGVSFGCTNCCSHCSGCRSCDCCTDCRYCCSDCWGCIGQCCCYFCRKRERELEQRQPAASAVVDFQLPSENLQKKDKKDIAKNHNLNRQNTLSELCSICLQPSTEVESSCYHQFHLSCLKAWENKSKQCPNCKQDTGDRFLRCKRCEGFSILVPKDQCLPAECNKFCCLLPPKVARP